MTKLYTGPLFAEAIAVVSNVAFVRIVARFVANAEEVAHVVGFPYLQVHQQIKRTHRIGEGALVAEVVGGSCQRVAGQ